jgi:hypothetical protein
MGDYHILDQSISWTLGSKGRDSVRVVFHIPVPNANNDVGVNYRVALVQYLEAQSETGTILSECPFITGPELTQMQAGEIHEVVESMPLVTGSNDVEKRQEVADRFAVLVTEKQTELAQVLLFWGYNAP